MESAAAWIPHAPFGLNPVWVSVLVLLAAYGVITAERLNRAIVAQLGALAMIALGILNQEEAIHGIDFNTIALLTGMMVLVGISRRSGLFQALAIWSAQRAKASPWALLVILSVTTALLSALLDNVTTVLLIAPVTLAITRDLEVPPYPFLFSVIFASNIGGTATLIGDPPNILIGSLVGLSFNQFLQNLAPIILLIMAVQALTTHLLWGRKLHATPEARARVMDMSVREAIMDRTLMIQSVSVIGAVMLLFVFARQIHLEPGTIALCGASVLMLLDNYAHHAEEQSRRVMHTFNEVEWITIFFFVGLFVIVHGVDYAGGLRIAAGQLVHWTGGDRNTTVYAVLWSSALLSSIVDNIPFVATMIPLIKAMTPTLGGADAVLPLWWALSLGACLGGNGTLIGASANLTVAGIGDRNGVPFRFMTYLKYAFPMMLVHIAICHVYVWLRYLAH
jgi:Na+/H+ antiporter NhaD/arsenite permease-like protein